jgi:hypothetical protein
MGLFSDVKCGRCDRRYSGLRARCPYCGARRGKRGKHARDNDNSRGRIVIGLILFVVLLVAVVVVVATNMTEQQAGTGAENQQTEQGGNIPDSDGVTNVDGVGAGDDAGADEGADEGNTDLGEITGTDGELEGEGEGEDESGVSAVVNNLYITNPWSEDPQTDFTASVGDIIRFSYVCEPEFADAEVLWESSDEDVFVVLQTGEFTAIGEGSGTLSLTVNNKKISLYVVVYD